MSDVAAWLRDIGGAGDDGGVIGRSVTPWMATRFVEAADEIERLRRAVNKMADAAGPAWTPRWVDEAPWRDGDEAP